MIELIRHYGLALVFANVLLERAGLPVPAMPTLLFCGALAADGKLPVWPVFAVAVLACVIGDSFWYFAGRIYGRRIMKLLCRVSLSPDSCVRTTENRFERWGKLTLVLAKFVPGLSTVARPLAGAMKLQLGSFEVLNGIGSALWVGLTLAAGLLLHAQIDTALARLREWGALTGELALLVLAGYIGFRWLQRRRFNNMLRIARITAEELQRRLEGDDRPVIVDVRSAIGRTQDRRCIPGALEMGVDEVTRRLEELPNGREIVLYCACPNEASASVAAKKLLERGYVRVRPLKGGLDAWIAAGYDVEERLATGVDAPPSVRLAVGPFPAAPQSSRLAD